MADLKLETLDAVEEGDRVAVRWEAAWMDSGERRDASIVAIYRFKDVSIAEDSGVSAREPGHKRLEPNGRHPAGERAEVFNLADHTSKSSSS